MEMKTWDFPRLLSDADYRLRVMAMRCALHGCQMGFCVSCEWEGNINNALLNC